MPPPEVDERRGRVVRDAVESEPASGAVSLLNEILQGILAKKRFWTVQPIS